jgi:hypothetical protein
MLTRFRRPAARVDAALVAEERRRGLLMRGLRELAGTTNGVVYDVPRNLRPEPLPGSLFLRSTAAWRSYLEAREQVDTGEPAIILALRPLDDEERELAVDWGTTYANMFMLVEPSWADCDLTDPANARARMVQAALDATLLRLPANEADVPEGWTRTTPLGLILRECFGTWVYWDAPLPEGVTRRVRLELAAPTDTLWQRLQGELHGRFPQDTFDSTLAYLHFWERELFGGPVPRARSVFRTRLGLPILRDVRCVDRALRRLVNQGAVTVVGAAPDGVLFGPGHPVPDEMSDEQFAQLVMA